jgi:hypothetical protein
LSQRRNGLFALLTLGALVAAILVAAPVAGAQTAGVDQYQPGGGGQGEDQQGQGGGGGDQAPTAGGGGIPSTSGAESDAGELPFTGYPLTGLLVLVGILVAAGLTFRLATQLRDRSPSRAAAGR